MSLQLGRSLTERWQASLAWSAEAPGSAFGVCLFRRTFELADVPQELVAFISANSRYRLWANGQPVGRGPLKGTCEHYYYEAYDLVPYLVEGKNVLAAEVRWFGEVTPTSEVHGPRPWFLVQGPLMAGLDTPEGWRVFADRSVSPDTGAYIANAHHFLGHWERVDGRESLRGWTEVEYDDGDWPEAVRVGAADVAGTWGESHPEQALYPRDVPVLVKEPRRFVRTWRDGYEYVHLFGEEPTGWELEAGEGGTIVLDAGGLTTGYPQFVFDGGADRTIELIYGECLLRIDDQSGYPAPVKGVRDDWADGDVHGYQDTVVLPGQEYAYEPFHWRTFWYVKIVVSEGETPLVVRDASYCFTTYPQTLEASFASDIPGTERLWKTSWRTLQLCAHETYEDCPYFEQLNYIADSRLQALCSLALAGETALPRRTIRLYRDSVRPDGLVCSRTPSTVPQILPYFALIWVFMVEDYWQYVGPSDRAFVRSNLHVIDGVLAFFRSRLQENGFVGQIPPWSMVDRIPGWERGEPPAIADGESTYLTCLFIYALDAAVRLHTDVGVSLDADRWRILAEDLRRAVRKQAWSEREGLYLEGPGREFDVFSQHAQAMAILSGTATAAQAKRILERLTTDPSLHRMKFMQSFYLARALQVAGGYAAFGDHVLSLWREALDKHLSTWPEYPDPTRSDCHAWSSWIAADFVRCGLGVLPYQPGFQEILISPRTEIGLYARGWAPTPWGRVSVDWRKDRDSGDVYLYATAPEGVPTRVKLPGMNPRRYGAGGRIGVVARSTSDTLEGLLGF